MKINNHFTTQSTVIIIIGFLVSLLLCAMISIMIYKCYLHRRYAGLYEISTKKLQLHTDLYSYDVNYVNINDDELEEVDDDNDSSQYGTF